jgi:hypothetical protein
VTATESKGSNAEDVASRGRADAFMLPVSRGCCNDGLNGVGEGRRQEEEDDKERQQVDETRLQQQ